MPAEQRRFPRTSLNEESIYFLHTKTNEENNERIYSPATIVDVSEGGLGMQVGIPHEIDDQLWLEGIDGFIGVQAARVKWVQDIADKEMFYIGVEFEGPSVDSRHFAIE